MRKGNGTLIEYHVIMPKIKKKLFQKSSYRVDKILPTLLPSPADKRKENMFILLQWDLWG